MSHPRSRESDNTRLLQSPVSHNYGAAEHKRHPRSHESESPVSINHSAVEDKPLPANRSVEQKSVTDDGLEEACCLRRVNNRWSHETSKNCALTICCVKEGDQIGLFTYIAMILCCYEPARCFTSARHCPSDSWFRTSNSMAFCCSMWKNHCCPTNDPAKKVTEWDLIRDVFGYSCREDELTGYEQGGLAEALRVRRQGPASQSMS